MGGAWEQGYRYSVASFPCSCVWAEPGKEARYSVASFPYSCVWAEHGKEARYSVVSFPQHREQGTLLQGTDW